MTKEKTTAKDLYLRKANEIIVARIKEDLEKAKASGKKLSFAQAFSETVFGDPSNYMTRIPYKGMNRLLTMLIGSEFYLTMNQIDGLEYARVAKAVCRKYKLTQKDMTDWLEWNSHKYLTTYVKGEKTRKEKPCPLSAEKAEIASKAYEEFRASDDWENNGIRLRKGCHSIPIYYYKMQKKPIIDPQTNTPVLDKDGNPKMKNIPLFIFYTMFSIDDVLNSGYERPKHEPRIVPVDIPRIENFLNAYPVKVTYKECECPCYRQSTDAITMPPKEIYSSDIDRYCDLFHEVAHSTGAKDRLDRDMTGVFGSKKYAREELVAELTSIFCSTSQGLQKDPDENSEAYLLSWLRSNDPSMLFDVAKDAQKAADYIDDYIEKSNASKETA
ncbi:MAG: zincin-like metallopeptidase domain-containing protein [Sphaerochaetaceae bacterium]